MWVYATLKLKENKSKYSKDKKDFTLPWHISLFILLFV